MRRPFQFFQLQSELAVAAIGFLAAVISQPPAPAHAEEITLQTRVDKTEAAVGEMVVFSVTISGAVQQSPELELGTLDGFKVVSRDQAQQIEIKAGRMTQKFVLTVVLAPLSPGTRVIGPVRMRHEGREYQSQPIEIKVTEGPPPQLKGGITL